MGDRSDYVVAISVKLGAVMWVRQGRKHVNVHGDAGVVQYQVEGCRDGAEAQHRALEIHRHALEEARRAKAQG